MPNHPLLLPSILLIFLAWSTHAVAANGVLEISHTCATTTGCLAGDTAGYPVTITGGADLSFVLTSDLVVPDASTDGISITTNDIEIDLNGFRIVRAGCENATTDCTPGGGTGSGVEAFVPSGRGVAVRNGSVIGMGHYGVHLGDDAIVRDVHVRWNESGGIFANNGGLITGNTVFQNGEGIKTFRGAIVSHNTVHENATDGIDVGIGSVVEANTVYLNGLDGIILTTGGRASGNTVYDNDSDGIDAGAGTLISGNNLYGNGSDGIEASSGSLVEGNSVRFNAHFGLNFSGGGGSGYRDNVMSTNTMGSVTGGIAATDLGGNLCAGSTTCP